MVGDWYIVGASVIWTTVQSVGTHNFSVDVLIDDVQTMDILEFNNPGTNDELSESYTYGDWLVEDGERIRIRYDNDGTDNVALSNSNLNLFLAKAPE